MGPAETCSGAANSGVSSPPSSRVRAVSLSRSLATPKSRSFGALCEIDGAHACASQESDDAVGSTAIVGRDGAADEPGGGVFHDAGELVARGGIVGEERFDF